MTKSLICNKHGCNKHGIDYRIVCEECQAKYGEIKKIVRSGLKESQEGYASYKDATESIDVDF